VIALTTSTLAADAHAQELAPRDANPAATLAGALIGGIAGAMAGGMIGAGGDCYEICGAVVLGFVAGEVVGVTLGAHVFNKGRGSLPLTLAASAGTVLAGLAAETATGNGGSDSLFWLTAGMQLAVVTAVQVGTSRRVAVSPMIRPTLDGVSAGVTLRW
jgi:hypothetical protein